jgi:tripartite-type tricarboxylate transporter receptor subunit TctC
LRNDLDLIVHTYAAVAPAIKDGSVRAIAGTAANRSAVLPTVPTLKESGLPGFEAASWNGIFARAGTPRRIVDRLNREINAVLSQDHVRKRLLDIGIEPLAGTPEELHARLRDDIARWRIVIEQAGIKRK